MNRYAVRLLSLLALVALVAGSLGFLVAGMASDPPPTDYGPAVERSCVGEEITGTPIHVTVNGVRVRLRCGDRFRVSWGSCYVERGTEYSRVPCTDEG